MGHVDSVFYLLTLVELDQSGNIIVIDTLEGGC